MAYITVSIDKYYQVCTAFLLFFYKIMCTCAAAQSTEAKLFCIKSDNSLFAM